MDQYEAMLATATHDHQKAEDELAYARKVRALRYQVRAAEDKAMRLRSVVEALTVYTTGEGLHLHWHPTDLPTVNGGRPADPDYSEKVNR